MAERGSLPVLMRWKPLNLSKSYFGGRWEWEADGSGLRRKWEVQKEDCARQLLGEVGL